MSDNLTKINTSLGSIYVDADGIIDQNETMRKRNGGFFIQKEIFVAEGEAEIIKDKVIAFMKSCLEHIDNILYDERSEGIKNIKNTLNTTISQESLSRGVNFTFMDLLGLDAITLDVRPVLFDEKKQKARYALINRNKNVGEEGRILYHPEL